jgi:hypothetical protein
MSIRERVDTLMKRLARERQFPTQGGTVFVDLEHHEIRSSWMPRHVVESFLGGRGTNMFRQTARSDARSFHPEVPLIFGTGTLTSQFRRRRAAASRRVPESKSFSIRTRRLFPVVLKLNGIDHLFLRTVQMWTSALRRQRHQLRRCCSVDGDEQSRVPRGDRAHFTVREGDLRLASDRRRNLVLCSGIMAGPSDYLAPARKWICG